MISKEAKQVTLETIQEIQRSKVLIHIIKLGY